MMDLTPGFVSVDDAATFAIRRTQTDIVRAYGVALNRMRAKVFDLYQSINGSPSPEEIMALKKYKDLVRSLQYQFSTLSGAQNDRLYKGISKAYKAAYRSETEKLEQILNIPLTGQASAERINFSLQNPQSGLPLSDTLTRNAVAGQYDLARDFNLAVRRGLPPGAVASKLQQSLEKQAGKLIRVLHTEGNRVINESVQAVFEYAVDFDIDDGIEKYWIHRSGPDGGSRADHVAMDGKVADDDGLFTLPNGHRGAGPGQFGYPEDDINCYCRMSIRNTEAWKAAHWK